MDSLILEETDSGLFLRKQEDAKMSWEDTYKAMSQEQEDWSDFDVTLEDGLEEES
jgi:antitoxin MazE